MSAVAWDGTPGPWRVTAQGPHQFHGQHVWLQVQTVPTRDAFGRENSDSLPVAMVASGVCATARADGCLIAAAPTMAEALYAAWRCFGPETDAEVQAFWESEAEDAVSREEHPSSSAVRERVIEQIRAALVAAGVR